MRNRRTQRVSAFGAGVESSTLALECPRVGEGHTARRPRLDTHSFRDLSTARPPAGKGALPLASPPGCPWTRLGEQCLTNIEQTHLLPSAFRPLSSRRYDAKYIAPGTLSVTVATYRRYQMELEVRRKALAEPELLPGYQWQCWLPGRCLVHARVKYESFVNDLDGRVFPVSAIGPAAAV